ncbi:hypothetical protein GOBAR_AA39637 [Gossypium barbadense]|uniref:DUF8003 domain-containing protein n=1 Tax=Gossypium barbadense TaxID=3634 RepID=A0A2P5VQI6_GOSBA|nr:hypothetical protein GOBAR_AA39637 [Gossypium barbadense]
MAKLTLLMRQYLCWSILFGHLYTSVLCLGLKQSENLFQKPRLVLRDESVSDTSIHFENSASLPLNDSLSCEDLGGVGSFSSTCLLNSNLYLSSNLYIHGSGNLEILPHVSIECPKEGCMITFNMSGNVNLGQYVAVVAGSVVIYAANLTVGQNSAINTTSLAGSPPPQTSGTPVGFDGAGGGHGGRGASCLKNNKTNFWGGDVYAWSTLSEPWSYGSKGGSKVDSASGGHRLGGEGGGRVKLIAEDMLYLNGSITAEGGDGGLKGGGGSGGSIYIRAVKLIQEDVKVSVHGGFSFGCPGNSGAAGTYFNADLLSLRVGNDNVTTETETPLLDFPTRPIWSNVFVENNAKVLVPLLWSRVQVRSQISLYHGGTIVFGLSAYPIPEFELVAEELLMSDSTIKVFGAFRVSVKMLLMWNSKIQIDGGGNTVVTASILEVRNLVVLRACNSLTVLQFVCKSILENSVINSNANLGVYGQGLLMLTGQGDAIQGQRLSLSLFYNITVGPGSLLQAPMGDEASRSVVTNSLCESQTCPIDLITPPDDCHICRVEDLLVNGIIKGSIIHIHRARTVTVDADGLITASELGCSKGIGKGNYLDGAGSGAGHGGHGGAGYFNGRVSNGGHEYGDADLPCELGSGAEGPTHSFGHVFGGGIIVMGSAQWPLLRLSIYGSLTADGQSFGEATINDNGSLIGGLGGGSGGTVLLFLQELILAVNSSLSTVGGNGGIGDEYVPVATTSGFINSSGGAGDNGGLFGDKGTVTGKKCPKGLYGTFCRECPIGTYKDIDGSDEDLCTPCSLELLPDRANFIYVRGGVREPFCPYKCISEKYRMPNCYTPFEELIYIFGGPWPFALLLSGVLLLLAVLLSTLRIKLLESSSYCANIEHPSSHHFPYLLSLSEVRGTRSEETQCHAYRMYFMGPNTFREPWHLPYSPPDTIIEIVSRALYKGMKVGATPDLMVAYIDFSLGGDEKQVDMYVPSTVWNRLVDGLNAQLRTVRHGSIRSALVPVMNWIASHGNPQLRFHGVKIELGWFQATASGYFQLGILVVRHDYIFQNLHQPDLSDRSNDEYPRKDAASAGKSLEHLQQSWPYPTHALSRRKIIGGINGGLINDATVKSLEFKRDIFFPFSLLVHNTTPIGHQDSLQFLFTTMLLVDLAVTLLTLIQFYWISLGAFLAVLLILPLSLLSPSPAGLNALFSKEPRRASHTRIYSLWNATSLTNIAVAFICGMIHYGISAFQPPDQENSWNTRREDDKWWLFPTILMVFGPMNLCLDFKGDHYALTCINQPEAFLTSAATAPTTAFQFPL